MPNLSDITPEEALERFGEMVEEAEDPDGVVPTLAVEFIDPTGQRQMLLVVLAGAEPPLMIAAFTEHIRELGDVRTAVFNSEGWIRAETNENGEMEECFKETAMVHFASKEAPEWSAMRVFVRTRDGVHWLEEPIIRNTADREVRLEGRVSDALKELVR